MENGENTYRPHLFLWFGLLFKPAKVSKYRHIFKNIINNGDETYNELHEHNNNQHTASPKKSQHKTHSMFVFSSNYPLINPPSTTTQDCNEST